MKELTSHQAKPHTESRAESGRADAHSKELRSVLTVRTLLLLGVVALLFAGAFAAPVLAATFDSPVEQGTVPPPPPPMPTVDDDDNSGRDSDDDSLPTATPTPVTVADASAQQQALDAPASFTGVVTSPRLNVRSGPNTVFASVGQHLQDEVVTVQYRDESGEWWYTCCISGTTTSGWSSASFIRTDFATEEGLVMLPVFPDVEQLLPPTVAATIAAASATPRPVTGLLTAVVNAQPRLLVRSAAGTESEILGRISDGTSVEVIARDESGDWWYVCCIDNTDTEGWVNAGFLIPDFDGAQANTLLPLFGASTLQLPTPTPTVRALPVITKMPKLLSLPLTPTPVTVAVPTVAATVPPVEESTPVPTAIPLATETPVPTAAPTELPEEEETATPVAAAPVTLQAVAWQEPAYAAPGDTVLLRYLITNTGVDIAREVHVRNELPAELMLNQGAGSPSALFDSYSTPTGATVYSLQWDALPAGESVSATVAVTLAPTLARGSVIYNLAAVGALNADSQTAPITIATPPDGLPLFR